MQAEVRAKEGNIKGDVMFNAKYDQYWLASVNGEMVKPQPYENRFNRYSLSRPTRSIDVRYAPQRWVFIGLSISICSLFAVLFNILFRRRS